MVIKQILEGARRFKPAPSSDPTGPGAQSLRNRWHWPHWIPIGIRRADKYLIAIRPLRLPRF